ncbi:hypothetical protein [Vibrio coralliirubri]|uniref:hypothetical protein n=1 Tax=Vibrio coralliirubri TaxID=1516159 RepID=UPI00076AA977|nr:hypothetical protein [Vibrio coralliirubri]
MQTKSFEVKQSILALLYFVLCFVLTRQFPLSLYMPSALSLSLIGFLVGFIFLYISKIKLDHRFVFLIAYLVIVLIFSFINSNDLSALPRFLFIILLINFVLILPFYKLNLSSAFNAAFLVHALFLIGFEIYLLIFFFGKDYSIIRQFFLSNNFGDVYTYSGYFYRIQIVGNALIPFAFMISYFNYRLNKGRLTFVVLYLLACIISANLMFIIAIGLFVALFEIIKSNAKFRLSLKNLIVLFIIAISVPFIVDFIYSNILLKLVGGDSSSLGTRFDQAYALMQGLTKSYYNIFFGQGLGSKLHMVTPVRDYSSFIYYELQAIYIFYQIGIVGFFLLVVLHLYLFLYVCKNKYLILIYIMYVFYAITNPYMFDTTQVVVLIYLVSLSKSNERCDFNKLDRQLVNS